MGREKSKEVKETEEEKSKRKRGQMRERREVEGKFSCRTTPVGCCLATQQGNCFSSHGEFLPYLKSTADLNPGASRTL